MTVHLEPSFEELEKTLRRLREEELVYYDEKKDQGAVLKYYRKVSIRKPKFQQLHSLVERTHKNKLPYFISKDQFLYTWVDLRPDYTIKSIYSGKENDPADLIRKDFEVKRRHEEFQDFLAKRDQTEFRQPIPEELKFNAEHIVPQSWYNSREPMKGDLHHLFVCEPSCNAVRSNFPYYDFPDYTPESPAETIRNRCGVAANNLFEPEFGKGAAARAMLYFLLRYPKSIEKRFRSKINFNLLRNWNRQFPPDLYEKHRNQAIYHIQGNRNPFIDFPELADILYIPLKW
ncbi:MAG TPA: endonuclease I [Bacillus bacterium]|uniref:endonuclease I family protein n=1 Tax=Siminovitchia fordii TaxID=254759 RepID=UPI000369ED9B|nr:endonuclease [Siminovitchia fordii]HBZ11194.1 endonuclease I [Bacillus sp. (in: firmicutes)]